MEKKSWTAIVSCLLVCCMSACKHENAASTFAATAVPARDNGPVHPCGGLVFAHFWDTRLQCVIEIQLEAKALLDRFKFDSVDYAMVLDMPVARLFAGAMTLHTKKIFQMNRQNLYLTAVPQGHPESKAKVMLVIEPRIVLDYQGMCNVTLQEIDPKLVSVSLPALPGFEATLKVVVEDYIWPQIKAPLMGVLQDQVRKLVSGNRYCRFIQRWYAAHPDKKDAPQDTGPSGADMSANAQKQPASHPVDVSGDDAELTPPPGYPTPDSTMDDRKNQMEKILTQ